MHRQILTTQWDLVEALLHTATLTHFIVLDEQALIELLVVLVHPGTDHTEHPHYGLDIVRHAVVRPIRDMELCELKLIQVTEVK